MTPLAEPPTAGAVTCTLPSWVFTWSGATRGDTSLVVHTWSRGQQVARDRLASPVGFDSHPSRPGAWSNGTTRDSNPRDGCSIRSAPTMARNGRFSTVPGHLGSGGVVRTITRASRARDPGSNPGRSSSMRDRRVVQSAGFMTRRSPVQIRLPRLSERSERKSRAGFEPW